MRGPEAAMVVFLFCVYLALSFEVAVNGFHVVYVQQYGCIYVLKHQQQVMKRLEASMETMDMEKDEEASIKRGGGYIVVATLGRLYCFLCCSYITNVYMLQRRKNLSPYLRHLQVQQLLVKYMRIGKKWRWWMTV